MATGLPFPSRRRFSQPGPSYAPATPIDLHLASPPSGPLSSLANHLPSPAHRSVQLLVIDDSERWRRLARSWLSELPARVLAADNLDAGLRLADHHPPDLILLDADQPGGLTLTPLKTLQQNPATRRSPVLWLSRSADPQRIARGLDLGAADYLVKPLHRSELQARVRAALRSKFRHDLLERRASSDALTNLGNRHGLEHRLLEAAQSCQKAHSPLAIWIADLDHFKRINDRHGHPVGDNVLRWAAGVLRRNLRSTDFAGRYGGEEFIVLCPHCDATGALAMAERFRNDLRNWPPPTLPPTERLTVSVGVAASACPIDPHELIRRADHSLYAAKQSGRDRTWFWNNQINAPTPGS